MPVQLINTHDHLCMYMLCITGHQQLKWWNVLKRLYYLRSYVRNRGLKTFTIGCRYSILSVCTYIHTYVCIDMYVHIARSCNVDVMIE